MSILRTAAAPARRAHALTPRFQCSGSFGLTQMPARRQRQQQQQKQEQYQQCRYSSSSNSPNLSELETSLPARVIPLTFDYLSPTPSHLLNVALTDNLPLRGSSGEASSTAVYTLPDVSQSGHLPPAHHMIYFPPAIASNGLLPDGTDALQSPGEPFVRRMWAGGSVHWNVQSPLRIDGSRHVCVERIKDVAIKGKAGEEKIFVGIERRVGRCTSDDEDDKSIRSRLIRDEESDFGDEAGVVERRNIVFMRGRSKEQAAEDIKKAQTKQMSPPKEGADYHYTLTPDEKLLFRYSALMYNAHSIHLDPGYCQDVEGHRGMLVHGPLSFTLLMTLLRRRLAQDAKGETLSFVEYRNLAPLYCHEPLKLCGRKKDEARWEVWAETPEGGVAVKGTVKTVIAPKTPVENDLKMLGF